LSFEAYGVQVELAFDEGELEPYLREILPPRWSACEPSASAGRFSIRRTGDELFDVTVHGAEGIQNAQLEVALALLDAQIRLYIAAYARDYVFVHAGVVARDSRALVIPGQSFFGKTTLVRALVEAGATYYSDEYAVLDEAGGVHAYPRALSIRGSDGTKDRAQGGNSELEADDGATLAVVAITRYRGGVEWRPKRRSKGQGLVALLANTVPAHERPEESLQTLRRAMAGATVLESDRGEAGPVARALLDELAAFAR
jgi:hypothetical protein